MKVQIRRNQAITHNHNQAGLKVKPQIASAMTHNHNQDGLGVKPPTNNHRPVLQSGKRLVLMLALSAMLLIAVLGNQPTASATPPGNTRVWRAQFRLIVADVSDAGTDDDIKVELNHKNITWLDYARDDYERNSDLIYDLRLNNLRRLSDITWLRFEKQGTNAICIRSMSLIINGRTIYTLNYGNAQNTCKWIDNGDGHNNYLQISDDIIHAHGSWQSFTQPPVPTDIRNEELQSRIEGAVGHRIKANKLSWGGSSYNLFGPGVEVSKKAEADRTVHVDLDLAYDLPGPNPEVDVDFDLTFKCLEGKIVVEGSNYDAHLYNFIYDYLKNLLPGWGSKLLNEMVNNHLKRLVSQIDLSSQFSGICPRILVTEDGDVVFIPR